MWTIVVEELTEGVTKAELSTLLHCDNARDSLQKIVFAGVTGLMVYVAWVGGKLSKY